MRVAWLRCACLRSLPWALAWGWCGAAIAAPATCRVDGDVVAAGGPGQPRVIAATLSGVPALLRIPARVTAPPLVLWHGFGPPASERALMDALPLDDVAAAKVYLGLPLFGRRLEGGNTDALARRQADDMLLRVFEPVVAGAARELPGVVAALREAGCIGDRERIGLFGFSAGGAAALYAMARGEVPVARAVVLNAATGASASVAAWERASGMRYAWSDASRALARETDAIGRADDIARGPPPPALLLLRGDRDAMLGSADAAALQAALVPRYASGDASRLALETIPGLGHDPTDPARLPALRRRIAAWFARSD